MKVSNKLTAKHQGHTITTRRADPDSKHYGFYHCETCDKFVTWITKEVYYEEKKEQRQNGIMWFGEYQGTTLAELPQYYLEWALLNVEFNIQPLVDEYNRREDPAYNPNLADYSKIRWADEKSLGI